MLTGEGNWAEPLRVGDELQTPFGVGTLKMYREVDHVYVLEMPYGMLYASKDSIEPTDKDAEQAQANKAMELNAAYEALEQMRRLNLEIACQECGIPPNEVDYEECTVCLLEGAIAARANSVSGKMSTFFKPRSENISSNMPRLKKFVAEREKKSKPHRCLTCGAPSCGKHASDTFRKEGITVCSDCERVFKMEFIVECLTLPSEERRQQIDKMIDLYDRANLLLHFSSQYIDDISESLMSSKERDNKINFGGSSAGIASGILGVAAAAAIVTPAGVPLLIASLMLGSGATAVQTGTEVNNRYFSEPNKLADRILALHGMLLSILSVTGTLRDAATADVIRTDNFDEDSPILRELRVNHIENRTELLAGMTAGRFAMGSAELLGLAEGAALARNANFLSRSSTAAMRTLRFARFAGGALAAATLVLEANSMAKTVKEIKDGSPCEKADALQRIKLETLSFPTTDKLDKECSAYLHWMDQRGRRMKEEEAVKLLLEVTKDAETVSTSGSVGDLILEGDEDGENVADATASQSAAVASETASTTSSMSGSLMERIQLFKKKDSPVPQGSNVANQDEEKNDQEETSRESGDNASAANMSSSSGSTLMERIELFKKSKTTGASSTMSSN